MKIRKSHLLAPLLTLCFMPEAHSLSLLMQKYHNVEFAVVEVSEHDSLQLFWKNAATEQPYQSFSTLNKTLQKEKQQLLFAINSGIFGQDQSPLGWHMEKGELLKGLNQITRTNAIGNFSLIPNGVFLSIKMDRAMCWKQKIFFAIKSAMSLYMPHNLVRCLWSMVSCTQNSSHLPTA